MASGFVRWTTTCVLASAPRSRFTVADHGQCAAEGTVLRTQPGGVFIVALERANRVFRDFVLSLAQPAA